MEGTGMDEHFNLDRRVPQQDDEWAERIGRQGAKIFFLGLAIFVALLLVAAGIAAVTWAVRL